MRKAKQKERYTEQEKETINEALMRQLVADNTKVVKKKDKFIAKDRKSGLVANANTGEKALKLLAEMMRPYYKTHGKYLLKMADEQEGGKINGDNKK